MTELSFAKRCLLIGLCSLGAVALVERPAQERDPREADHGRHRDADGLVVLWTPRDIESLDLFWGPGGQEGGPDVARTFTFAGTVPQGKQKKIYTSDDRGRQWTVKYGPEARPETAASRIVWAMGYHADQDYYVESVQIHGLPGGESEAREVRFERRDDGFPGDGDWDWDENPFIGTREMDGLKTLMMVLSNWDLKAPNNKIVRASHSESQERIFYVGDLGASFGRTGSLVHAMFGSVFGVPAGSKDKPLHYAGQEFIDEVRDGTVAFSYKGRGRSDMTGVRVANAKWMGDLLARLSDRQLADTFRASGYDPSEAATLTGALKERTRQLQCLPIAERDGCDAANTVVSAP